MRRIFSMCLDAGIAAVVLIPLFLILNQYYLKSTKKTVNYFIFAVYLSGMFAVVGLPDIRYVRFDPNFNFVPFAYMFSDFTNSFLNVLLFVPLGFFLPVFWKHFTSLWRTGLFGLCTSLLIEVLQIFTYRATDVNDLMPNTLGTLIGWLIAKLVLHFCPAIAPGDKTQEVAVVCGTAFSVMFFVQPFLANWIFLYL